MYKNLMYKKILVLTIIFAVLAGCHVHHDKQVDNQKATAVADQEIDKAPGNLDPLEKNVLLVTMALTEVFDKTNPDLIPQYWSENYIQHTPSIKDGIAGVTEAITGMRDAGLEIKREIIRTLAEGDLVYVQSRVSFGGSPNMVVVDIFRVENEKLVEHWDTTQAEVPASETANGNGMLDGGGDASKKVSADYLTANKQTVVDFIEKGFAGDAELLDSLFGEEYIQHNPEVANGKEVVLGFLDNGGFSGKVHKSVAQGDLVAVLVEYGEKGEFHNACVDLFRMDDNSKVVEHWDTCMAVPADSEFAHDNGMF